MIRSPIFRCVLLAGVALALPAAAREGTAPDTLDRIVPLPGVEVRTSRADARAPLAVSRLGRDEILALQGGQDTPMALAKLPGVYAASDAGHGIGYSYLSIRGFPQRRISVIVDGVPLNDPQSHEVYWIDHPDLLASASEVQVIRGVGPALHGAAALGGTVTIETMPFSETPRATLLVGAGGFGTRRFMAEAQSGPIAGGFHFYARASRIVTDGYREQSWSRLASFALGAERERGPHRLRLQYKYGDEATHLAYLGVPADYLEGRITGDAGRDRRFNPLTFEGEQDRFVEPHLTLTHHWSLGEAAAFTQTLFWFDGRGAYDERRFGHSLADYRLSPWSTTDSTLVPREYYARDDKGNLVRDSSGRFMVERFDVVRRREALNRQFGWLPRVRLAGAGGLVTLGGELRMHGGQRVGRVLSAGAVPAGFSPGQRYYDYHPRTLSAALFARHEWNARRDLRLTSDLAWRHQGYAMRDDRFEGIRFDQRYNFLLPRLGAHWRARPALGLHAAWAMGRREPAFRDLYDAEGVGSRPLYRVVDVAAGIYDDPLVRPERVQSWEVGADWTRPEWGVSANLFRMDFRDELVFAGRFDTDLGYPVLGNAARSSRTGVECAGRVSGRLADARLGLTANASISDLRYDRYREQYGPSAADEVRYDGNAIAGFPAVMAHAQARGEWRGAAATLEVQHAGRIFVDATESIAASIGPRTLFAAAGSWRRSVRGAEMELRLRVDNLLDTRHATSGYLDFDRDGALVPHFVPAAGRSALFELQLAW